MANSVAYPPQIGIESMKTAAREVMRSQELVSPCESCHNFSRCIKIGTAAFTIMGPHCTRNCRFCSAKYHRRPKKPDIEESERIAETVDAMGLRHVVLTSVSRDDLKDMGAGYFARCISEIKWRNPGIIVEAFIPDFDGRKDLIKKVLKAKPDIIGHSLETVKRLHPIVRDRRAGYRKSLQVLRTIRQTDRNIIMKSSLMLGFREYRYEVIAAMRHLRRTGVDILAIGQYIRPTKSHLRVLEYVPRDVFEFYEREAYQLGFRHVVARPLAKHSYPSTEMIRLMHGI
jgi:lipoic acid synthetase